MPDPNNRLVLFPLPGAILLPDMHLPLHIFEPRYRAMIGDAMVRGQRIGMIQPREQNADGDGPPALFQVGCVGHMVDIEAMEDGRYNILLEGEQRFSIKQELTVKTPFRQAEVVYWDEASEVDEALASVERAALEGEARHYASHSGYEVDWAEVEQLDDHSFVNGMAMVVPFDISSKQALLETRGLSQRAELLMEMLQFNRRHNRGAGPSLMN